jgi:hypothetical protein
VAEPEDAVVVEHGQGTGIAVCAPAQGFDPDTEVEFVGREPDPVLELVGGYRRSTTLDQEQAWLPNTTELIAPVLFGRPLDESHLHGWKGTDQAFRVCFGRMNVTLTQGTTAQRRTKQPPTVMVMRTPAEAPTGP